MDAYSLKTDKKKEHYVQEVFQSIAPKYDLMNDILSFRQHKAWRNFTMCKMNVQRGATALDLCCGTCDWTIQLAQASQSGKITGLDFSSNMLAVGQKKIKQRGLGQQIELVEGNAMDLPFPDDSFDYVTIGFGLRNVTDYRRVIREMCRVVKLGGQTVCLELSRPTWQPFKGVYALYFRHLLPMLGKWIAKRHKAYRWLPESLAMFPERKELEQLFKDNGFEHVQAYLFFGGIATLHMGTKEKGHA